MISASDERFSQRNELLKILNLLEGAIVNSIDPDITDELTNRFFELIEKLPYELLPYTAVSQFVYNNENEDFSYFIEKLESIIIYNFLDCKEDVNYKKSMKILEHMDLAKQQKDSLYEKHEMEIQRLQSIADSSKITSVKIQTLQNASVDLQEKTVKLQKTTEELQEENSKIITNYISILGIFAAVLMGAFGAVQSFSNLFENAHRLDMGKIFIISSIGASSVVLILFFLLNAIAKLTGKSLWSTKKENGTLLEKHPSLVIVHGILIFIFLIGSALELSNISIQFAWQGLWWALPLFWISYLLIAVHKQNYLFFVNWFKRKRKYLNLKGE